MHCETAKDLICEGRSAPGDQRSLKEHLESCDSCRGLADAYDRLQQLANDWTDEPVPAWSKPIPMGVGRATPNPWLQWLPLAACLCLTLLVVFKAEISWNKDGFRLSFAGDRPQTLSQPQEFVSKQALNLAMNDLKGQITDALFLQNQNTDAALNQVRVQVNESHRLERGRLFELLADKMNQQRIEDLEFMEDRIRHILNRQNRNTNQLYQLTTVMNRVPEIRNQM